jgi:hypothetical protein
MEKGSDSVLPCLDLEGFSDHPEPEWSSGRETLISSPSEFPATRTPTFQPRVSREKSYRGVPIDSRRSQLPKEPLEPGDMRHEVMRNEGRFSKKRLSRVGCISVHLYVSDSSYA